MPSSSPSKTSRTASSTDKLAVVRANAIGRLLLLARKSFMRRVTQELRDQGKPELPAAFLSLSPYIDAEGTRNTDLAERAGVTKQAIGKIVKEYELNGLLMRTPDESDGRAWRVSITAEGLRQLAQTYRVVARIEKHYEALIGPDLFPEVRRALRLIVDDAAAPGAVAKHRSRGGKKGL
ncbi:MarR family winged helix-turn-helix transcriptional regulator [Hydrogenophaga sp. BPS33]|uniref:MarR family winged helix-turn-helix transcriptional regulator n=1 Tax=Hydrogenophaga sp. BPS33 TaxID=2651974 RepID=UPI0019174129|nr:MarR family transcriptional regulator [Hydrogenophaga sp. BPS33]